MRSLFILAVGACVILVFSILIAASISTGKMVECCPDEEGETG